MLFIAPDRYPTASNPSEEGRKHRMHDLEPSKACHNNINVYINICELTHLYYSLCTLRTVKKQKQTENPTSCCNECLLDDQIRYNLWRAPGRVPAAEPTARAPKHAVRRCTLSGLTARRQAQARPKPQVRGVARRANRDLDLE